MNGLPHWFIAAAADGFPPDWPVNGVPAADRVRFPRLFFNQAALKNFNQRQTKRQRGVKGQFQRRDNFPASMALIVWREIPVFSARSCWAISLAKKHSRRMGLVITNF